MPCARQGAQAARRGRAFDGVTIKPVKAQCVTTKQSGKVQPRDGSAAKARCRLNGRRKYGPMPTADFQKTTTADRTSPKTQPAHSLVDNSAKGKNCVRTKNCAENRTDKTKKCHEFCTTYAKIRDINYFKFNLPHVPKEGGETPFLPRERFRANADRALAKRGIHSDAPSVMSPQGANRYRHGCMKLPVQTTLRTATTALAV